MIQMQKVIKVGNSLAITMDSKFIQEAGIKVGQEMAVVYKPERGLMSLAKSHTEITGPGLVAEEKQAYISGKITPELEAWTKKFLIENQESMKTLADL